METSGEVWERFLPCSELVMAEVDNDVLGHDTPLLLSLPQKKKKKITEYQLSRSSGCLVRLRGFKMNHEVFA